MAHKKGMGSSRNGRDSHSKRLGVKIYGGQLAKAGNIIVRQRGTKFHPGNGVGIGRDHTIFATVEGEVVFEKKANSKSFISVIPFVEETVATVPPKPEKEPKAEKPTAVESPVEEIKKAPEAVAEKPKAKKEATKAKAATPEKKEETRGDEDNLTQLLEAIGKADKKDKQDLKELTGVGPAVEDKLNKLGIYTYAQVAKVGKKELKLLHDLDASVASRFEKDEWAKQAKELDKNS